ncbi:MAG: Membrane-associated protein, SNARE-like protein [Candidatus Moranbacteria bacterium GW2011_GWC2_37_73]|nr:MAG: hypothetical protein UR95_C0004G0027 [Parcubacteria group bacterium GW2011_GWC1_36_108]KKQ38972.1 MAG: Membrane-associated protein, SNARE-like protein [Candidatus Moranbacteria bacterium GW2011_GWC2_37_73]HAR99511.1 hypothetical protein [Candidatus Moranbacteria bacterium]HBU11124.1 hypothetical protein [Candidatus Moranbacteria bacterium]
MMDPHFQNNFGEIGFILETIKNGSYFGIFLFSMLVSYIVPIPEAVFLLLVGFLARKAGFDLEAAVFISIIGTIIGDNILYRLSFFGNKHIERFNRKMRANKLIQYENLVIDNVGKTIFFLRFITGVRFFGPVISGTLRASWKKFFFYNAIATTLHAVFFILLGFYLHRRIIPLVAEVEIARNALLFSSVLIVGVLLKLFSRKKV